MEGSPIRRRLISLEAERGYGLGSGGISYQEEVDITGSRERVWIRQWRDLLSGGG